MEALCPERPCHYDVRASIAFDRKPAAWYIGTVPWYARAADVASRGGRARARVMSCSRRVSQAAPSRRFARFTGAAVVFCLPQLVGAFAFAPESHWAFVELQGKAAGCAVALFCAPIVSHRLGYE